MDHEAGARRKSFRFSEDREKIAAVRTLSVHAAEIHKYRGSGRSALAEPRGLHNVSRAECSMKRADARSTGHEGGNVGERASKKEKERERKREEGGARRRGRPLEHDTVLSKQRDLVGLTPGSRDKWIQEDSANEFADLSPRTSFPW